MSPLVTLSPLTRRLRVRCPCQHALSRARGTVTAVGRQGALVDLGGRIGFLPAREGGAALAVGRRWSGHVAAEAHGLAFLAPRRRSPAETGAGRALRATVLAVDERGVAARLVGPGRTVAVVARRELSWMPVPSVAAVLRPGDEIAGELDGLTLAGPRLSPRALVPNPWPAVALALVPGADVPVEPLRRTPAGVLLAVSGLPFAQAWLPGPAPAAPALVATVLRVDVAETRLVLGDLRPASPAGAGPRRATAAATGARRARRRGARGS